MTSYTTYQSVLFVLSVTMVLIFMLMVIKHFISK